MSSLELNPDEQPWKIEARVVGYGQLDPKEHVSLNHEQLREADFSGRKLKHFSVVGCRFERCWFEKMRVDSFIPGAGMELSEYVDCSFDGIRVSYMSAAFARFIRCSFRNVDIRDWRSSKAEFIDCVFTGQLEECIFYGTVPEQDRSWVGRAKNEFRGNDFSGCDLVDVAFRTGIDLEQQKLPTGPEYLYLPDAAGAIERAKATVQEWYDAGMRERGLSLLSTLAMGVEGGQRQELFRANDFYGIDPLEVVDGVFAALRD
jgi:uncharacterized protein YjbI with pentapeptide repeats